MEPLLKLEKVSIHFGGLVALNEVDLQANLGQITAIIGPNGAGKTTLFNIVTRQYMQDKGLVAFRDRDLASVPAHAIAGLGITRTFQNIRILPSMTVLENVLVGLESSLKSGLFAAWLRPPSMRREERDALKKSMEALEFMGLADKAQLKASGLPYGARRKLEMARALVSDPSMILLDEPAAGMNATETEDLKDLIVQLRTPERAVILIEHDMSVAMGVSDYLFVLNFGKMIAEGKPAAVQQNSAVIEAYLGTEDIESILEAEEHSNAS